MGMVKQVLLKATVLAAAVGIPIACFLGPEYWPSATDPGSLRGSAGASSPREGSLDGTALGTAVGAAGKVPVEGTPAQDLAEVFRFDMDPQWILKRWPRVSAGLANLQLQGYRVPLVTGTGEADLAGSLTYYFNSQQTLQRITFRGTTGDASRLVDLLTSRHHFTRRLANNPGLVIYEVPSSGGEPKGLLKIQPAEVVKANEPCRRFDLELMIERPS